MNAESPGSRFAVITGASSAMGFEVARQFARQGYDLLICANDPTLHTLAEELKDEGVDVSVCQASLAHEKGVEELLLDVQAQGRPVNAIAITLDGDEGVCFRDSSWTADRDRLHTHVLATVYLTKEIMKDMIRRKDGKILFTSALAPLKPDASDVLDGASRAFLYSFSASLHHELKGRGIQVTALLPAPEHPHLFYARHLKNDPVDLARQAFAALMNGEENGVSAGFKAKIETSLGRMLPFSAKGDAHH